MGVSEKREGKAENVFKEMIEENFPNLGRDMDFQVQETQRTPNEIHPKNYPETHYIQDSKSQRQRS